MFRYIDYAIKYIIRRIIRFVFSPYLLLFLTILFVSFCCLWSFTWEGVL